jgi:hypothetical protein
MWAMLTPASPLFARPTNSSIRYGLLPAAVMRVGILVLLEGKAATSGR